MMFSVFVQFAILTVQVLCVKGISTTDNFRNKIALEVLKVSPVNTVVSSLALKLPLCKLASIAKGDAKTELMSALGIQLESKVKCYEPIQSRLLISELAELMMHNRIYLNDSIDVNPDFKSDSMTEFGVRIERVGFRLPNTAAKYMNRWVASDTLSRVTNIIDDDDINANTSMVLVSGLHFKGSWESPFDIRFTTNKFFRDANNKPTKIPMMAKIGNFDYADDVNYNVKILNLKFTSMGSSITFIMPDRKNGLPGLLDKLSNDTQMMKNLRSRLKNKYLKILVPRMKIKTYVDWTDFLRLIGINKILDPNHSGLENILKNGTTSGIPVHLSKAKQKVFIDIDEMGVTRNMDFRGAGRVRDAMEMMHLGGRTEEFSLDQPFYFVVSLVTNREHYDLFNGIYTTPEL